MSRSVGLIGLGLMGSHIARRLLATGFDVVGFDPVPEQRARLEESGGRAVADIAAVVAASDVVLLSLPDGSVSLEVCTGPGGIIDSADRPRPLVVVETTTARPAEAVELARRLGEHGIQFLDMGLSGSGPMISAGKGLGVVGGPEAAWDTVSDVLEALCERALHVGGHGAGMTAKLIINFVLYVNRLALAEGLLLAERAGIAPDLALEMLRSSAARSTAMEIWGDRMAERRYDAPTSRIRQHVKDVRQIVELAGDAGLRLLTLPQVALVAERAHATGLDESDNAVVIEVVRELSGAGAAAGDREHSTRGARE